jgi:hypothetical protein
MSSYRETVAAELERLETNHLVHKLKHGALTEDAHSVAVSILRARGHNLEGIPLHPDPDALPDTQYLKETAEERKPGWYMLAALASVTLLPIWAPGCAMLALGVAEGRGAIGAALGLLSMTALAVPLYFSAKAWRTALSDSFLGKKVNKALSGLWIVSIGGNSLWLIIGTVGSVWNAFSSNTSRPLF